MTKLSCILILCCQCALVHHPCQLLIMGNFLHDGLCKCVYHFVVLHFCEAGVRRTQDFF
uniref:Uncharacterized protein n=1 Tax=Anguilla anguilla TaxID=7936 RepID=A0A0E9WUQ5_ANGAN